MFKHFHLDFMLYHSKVSQQKSLSNFSYQYKYCIANFFWWNGIIKTMNWYTKIGNCCKCVIYFFIGAPLKSHQFSSVLWEQYYLANLSVVFFFNSQRECLFLKASDGMMGRKGSAVLYKIDLSRTITTNWNICSLNSRMHMFVYVCSICFMHCIGVECVIHLNSNHVTWILSLK